MEAWSNWNRLGVYNTVCSKEAFTPAVSGRHNVGTLPHSWRLQRLELYLKFDLHLKCYELLDTIFLALLNKSIGMSMAWLTCTHSCAHVSTAAVFHIYHRITNVLIAVIELDERVTLVRYLVLHGGMCANMSSLQYWVAAFLNSFVHAITCKSKQ